MRRSRIMRVDKEWFDIVREICKKQREIKKIETFSLTEFTRHLIPFTKELAKRINGVEKKKK